MEAASTLARSLSLLNHPRPRTLLPLRRASSLSVVVLHELQHEEDGGNTKKKAPEGCFLGDGGCGGRRNIVPGAGGNDMGGYYRRVLRADPENPLLLRNYGAYLHDVEHDLAGAEACYARALLACPGGGDADLLCLYGRVIWEARQEKDRAAQYLERATQAAPGDSHLLGAYAAFLWDAAEEDDEDASAAPAIPQNVAASQDGG